MKKFYKKGAKSSFYFCSYKKNDKILKFNMLTLIVETKKRGDEICGYKSCKGRGYKG